MPPDERDARDASPPPREPSEALSGGVPVPNDARPGVRGASPRSKPEGDDGADARDSLEERASAAAHYYATYKPCNVLFSWEDDAPKALRKGRARRRRRDDRADGLLEQPRGADLGLARRSAELMQLARLLGP